MTETTQIDNFKLLKVGINTEAVAKELLESTAWDWMNLRKIFPGSQHTETSDLVFRFAPTQEIPLTFDFVMNSPTCVNYWPFYSHPAMRALVLEAFTEILPIETSVVGRIVASRLQPGGVVGEHIDEGAYAEMHDRYHIVVDGESKMTCNGESAVMASGELWKFNHHTPHSVINTWLLPRTTLIVDIRK